MLSNYQHSINVFHEIKSKEWQTICFFRARIQFFKRLHMRILSALIALFLLAYPLFSQELSVEKIWKNYLFYGKSVAGFRSMQDGNYFTKITSINGKKGITKHGFSNYSGEGEVLVHPDVLVHDGLSIQMDDFSFNTDESKVLITTETRPIYRRSFTAIYYLLDLNSNTFQPLDKQRQPQALAEYSPDGKKVAYIFENNLYIKTIETGEVQQVTVDGEKNRILNGSTDWVYEEEFAITKAYGWSHDSQYLAFLRFDEREVKEFTMTYYNDLYPDLYTFKYPKAGEDNSKVTLHMYSLREKKNSEAIHLGEYEYIPRMKWSATNNQLVVQSLNRHQNYLKYHLIEMKSGEVQTKTFFEEKSDSYVEIDDNLLILNDGMSILRTSEINGYNHIYKLSFDGVSTPVTKGNWDVIEFLGVDDKNTTLYYSSAENGAIYKSIYKIGLNGKKKKCISSQTGWNEAEFSNGMHYFIKIYSNANSPEMYSLCDNNGKEITILEDNKNLKQTLSDYKLGVKEFLQFRGHDTALNGWILKPHNFDASKKYPVYINIYGGPGSNMVKDEWGGMNFMYHQLLAQSGYIVVSVDPRGTMYRGSEFKKSTYLNLGKLETEDFIAVAKELQEFDFVDPDRIGIMGWSYGGFMTSLAMTKGEGLFKMGIAVAPVTNWRYYDNIYTERFMRTPQENPNGYDENSPIHFVDQLSGNYLLIHGSGDDNVHYQNTMEMVNALVKANKQFDLFIYPNKNHGIYGGNTRNHLFQLMFDYTLKNL